MGCLGSSAGNVKDKVTKALAGEKARVVMFIGGPNSQRDEMAKKIAEEFNYALIDCGNVVNNVIQTKSALWEDLQADLTSGGLVNSSRLIQVIKLKMPSDNKKVLLNGFPKSKDNIDTWNKEMAESADIKGYVYLQVSDEKMAEVAVGDYAANVQTKINTFKTETLPVVDSLKAGDNFFTFDGSKNADELFNDIKQKFLDKKLYQ
jgi:adenylate kinase family enzyme